MISKRRLRAAIKASGLHLLASVAVAALAATLVFLFWYPYPYPELAGGRELFLIVVAVDVICGPLLTAVLFNQAKPRAELLRDLGLVALIQFVALGYGLHSVWQARPLFLVMEKDRFKVVAAPDLEDKSALRQLNALPTALRSGFFSGPVTVAIREPIDAKERKTVLFESIQGGRDYALRPEFYLPYEGANALKSLDWARPLSLFLDKQPAQHNAVMTLATEKRADQSVWKYVPVIARKEWIAILNDKGEIEGFLPGDGF